MIGPLSAGALAIGVGFTDSWHTALEAGLCVLGVRLVEDYVVVPRVLGDAAASLKASAAEKAQERQHDDDNHDEHDEEKTRLLSTRQVAGGLRQS